MSLIVDRFAHLVCVSLHSKIETMHPSDSRMSSWARNITVGSTSDSGVPMAVFKAVGPLIIKFSLSSVPSSATLEIGTTLAFAGARPVAQVNSWTSATPAIPTQPDSRGVTRGTWRGNNYRYTYNIRESLYKAWLIWCDCELTMWFAASGTLVTGTNTITISAASGSSGDLYL